jgi:hypothetical protein
MAELEYLLEFEASLRAEQAPPLSFRAFAESPEFCNLNAASGRPLSPMVAAIMDASDGIRPTTITDAECLRYFGCALDRLPTTRATVVAGGAGGRGGKSSRLLATKALHAAWTVPLPTLAPNEHALALVVSSELVFARKVLQYVVGYVEGSPTLSRALVGEPGKEGLTLRRPDGRLVDIQVRAAGARGKGGRANTLVCALLDEFCFFYDDSGVINDREIVRAASPRIAPGGQMWMLSTPWIADVGVLEEELAANWGSHTETLCFRGVGTKVLNPTWDPDGKIEAKERRTDPDNARREIDAIPLTAGTKGFLSREAIEAMFSDDLPQRSPRNEAHTYGAGADTGFRKNSSALALVERIPNADPKRYPTYVLALLEERVPSAGVPLVPETTVGEFADLMRGYGVRQVSVDAHEREKVQTALTAKGCTAVDAPPKEESYVLFKTILHEGRIKSPPNPRLRQQLRDIVAKPQPGGGTSITSPQKADGSHGDLVSALVAAVWQLARPVTTVQRGRILNV